MKKNPNWRFRIAAGAQVLAMAVSAGAAVRQLYRYVQYGNRPALEAGAGLADGETADTERMRGESAETERPGGGTADIERSGGGDADTETTDTKEAGARRSGALPASVRVRILDDASGPCHAAVELTCEEAFIVEEHGTSDAEGQRAGGAELDDPDSGSDGATAGSGPGGETEPDESDFGSDEAASDSGPGGGAEPDEPGSGSDGAAAGGQPADKARPRRVEAGEVCRISAGDIPEGGLLCVRSEAGAPITVTSLERADGHPAYAGTLCLYGEVEGIALINELPLEEYLCAVVSSEMPSDYPMEAQKAQAVCARTYACVRIREAERTGAPEDLDDSVNFQVYNNYRSTEISREAVRTTAGEILSLDEIQYYSTSCQSEHREDLGDDAAFRRFLEETPDAGAEYDSPWLRWQVTIPERQIADRLSELYGQDLQTVDEIRVTERAGNGQAIALEIRGGGQCVRAEGEYRIREVLSPVQETIRLMDGSGVAGMKLLPSAFFCVEGADGGAVIRGGGYGHGNGMSQCGAAAMAAQGADYREILEYYYACGVQGSG